MPLPSDLAEQEAQEISRANVFSFDEDLLRTHLQNDEIAIAIIRAHLYVDHVLSRCVQEALLVPTELAIDRLGFGTKVGLAIALGGAPASLRAPITLINDWRNEVAHNLRFTLDDGHKRALWNAFPPPVRSALKTPSEGWPRAEDDASFGEMLAALVFWLDIARQKAAEGRVRLQFAQEHLKRALARTRSTG